MNPRYTSDPAWAAEDLHGKLTSYDIKLPANAESAWRLFQDIIVPGEPDQDAAARAIAFGNKPADVDKLIEAEVFGPARRRAAIQAKRIAGSRFLGAVQGNAQEIHDQLQPIADELIADITEAAQDGAVSLTQLVREGRHHDARLRADLDVNIAKLAALQNLRDMGVWQVSNSISAAGVDCRQFKAPLSLAATSNVSSDKSTAARWHNLLVAHGGELHFWTPAQYLEAAERYTEELQRGELQRQQQFFEMNRRIDAGFGG